MIVSAINDKFEWRFNFPSPIDEENLASQITTSQNYR